MSKKVLIVLVLLAAFVLSGCYINDDVRTDQVGVRLKGGRIIECVGPGVYTDLGFFADLREVSSQTLTFSVSDPEVVTSNNQPVGITITVQAKRKTSCVELTNLLSNWSGLMNDDQLIAVVSATAREGIKVGTRGFTLQQLLDDRNGLSLNIKDALEEDATEYSVDIVNVTIENIDIDDRYAEELQQQNLLTAQLETAKRQQELIKQEADNNRLEEEQRTTVLEQQLLAEQAQTDVQVEIAERAGEVTRAQNEVYTLNEQAYELERLRLMEKILGDKSVVYFLPEGADLSLFLQASNQPQVVPLPVQPEEQP